MTDATIPREAAYRPPISLQEALGSARRVFVTAHLDPDADGLGCALGLAHVLRREGWTATPVCIGRRPFFATTLPGREQIVEFPSRVIPGREPRPVMEPGDALVVVDTPSAARMAAFFDVHASILASGPLVNIDHHFTNEQFGTANFVDATAAASAEVVYDILVASGLEVDTPAALCLMTALVADTQGFRTESTSPRSLLLAYRLWEAGAPLFSAARAVFASRPLAAFHLWGAALATLESRDGVVWATVTERMLRESGVTLEEVEGLVDFLLASRDVRVAILLKQQGAETRVSMRTVPGVDATQIVGAFGGGGHQRAAGCTVASPPHEAIRRLLPLVQAELENGAKRQ